MNHDTLVRRGRLPWCPTADASDLDVWHEYDVPLTGTFRVGDATVLFAVVGSADDALTVWAYKCLSSDTAADLEGRTFKDVDEMGRFIDGLFQSGEAVFATAGSDLLIDYWTPMRVSGGLLESAGHFLDTLLSRFNRAPAHSHAGFRTRLMMTEATIEESGDDLSSVSDGSGLVPTS